MMRAFLDKNNLFKNLSVLLFLIIISLFIYYPTLNSAPLWDDWIFIFKSWTLKNIAPVKFWYWGDHRRSWPMFYTIISGMFKMWGEDVFKYHLLSVLLHACNSFFLFKILKKINGTNTLTLALIFLIHPIHFFSVAWIIQIKTLLCIFFFLISLDQFIDYRQKRFERHYWFSVILFGLSVLSKAAFAPIVLLFAFFDEKKRMIPYSLLCIYAISLTIWSTHLSVLRDVFKESTFSTMSVHNIGVAKPTYLKINLNQLSKTRPMGLPRPAKFTSPINKVILTFTNFSKYVRYVFYPSETLLIHPTSMVNDDYLDFVISMAVIWVSLFIFIYYYQTKNWIALGGVSFFVISLIPLCGIIHVPIFYYSNFVEYWLSIPLLGVILCLAKTRQSRLMQVILFFVVIVFGIKSYTQARKNNTSNKIIINSSLKSPQNDLIHLLLAKQYFYAGDYIQSNEILLPLLKKNTPHKERIKSEIDLNTRAINGESIDDTSL